MGDRVSLLVDRLVKDRWDVGVGGGGGGGVVCGLVGGGGGRTDYLSVMPQTP